MFLGAMPGLETATPTPSPSPGQATPRAEPEVPATPTDLAFTAANNSPALAVDPSEPRFVVAAYRVDAPMFSCGLQVSGDGGRGWTGADPVPKLPKGADRCYAPEVAFDPDGTLYYLFVGLAGEGNSPIGVFLTTSTDRARSWRTPWQILEGQNYMVRLGIATSGKPARLHLAWLHSSVDAPLGGLPGGASNPILSAHSDDGGRTFSAPVQVSDANRERAIAPSLVVGPDGAVHVAYYDLGDDARDYQGLEGPTWEGTWSVVMSTSPDRGGTFGAGVVVAEGIVPSGRVMLIFTMPPPAAAAGPAGHVYVAWPDARAGAGGADVLLSRSTDAGGSWSPARRINDNTPTTPGRAVHHELPRIGVAADGRVDVAFLDRRNDPENLKADVYFTSSADGGDTFGPNVRLTTEPSDSRIGQRYRIPSAAGLVELGSRIAVLSRPDEAVVAWPDMRNASIGTNQQDIFATTVVDLGRPAAAGASAARAQNTDTQNTDTTAIAPKRAAVEAIVQEVGTPYELFGVSFAGPRDGHVVGAGGTILATADGATTWVPQPAPVVVSPEGLAELLPGVSFPDARNGHIAGLGGTILVTSDGGASWTTQQPPPPVAINGQEVAWAFEAVSFLDREVGYIVGGRSGILRTTDGGASWQVVADPRFGNLMDVVAIDRLNGQAVGWSGQVTDGLPFVSLATADGGATWEPRLGEFKPGVAALNFNGVSFVDPMHGWAVGDEGRIVATTDGGRTWTLQHSGSVDNLTGVSFFDTRRGVAVGTLGLNTGAQKAIIYATDDGGQTWVSRFVSDTVRLRGGVDFADRSTAYAVGCRRDAPGSDPEQPTCEAGVVARIAFLEAAAPSSGSSGAGVLVWVLVIAAGAGVVVGGAVVLRRRGARRREARRPGAR